MKLRGKSSDKIALRNFKTSLAMMYKYNDKAEK